MSLKIFKIRKNRCYIKKIEMKRKELIELKAELTKPVIRPKLTYVEKFQKLIRFHEALKHGFDVSEPILIIRKEVIELQRKRFQNTLHEFKFIHNENNPDTGFSIIGKTAPKIKEIINIQGPVKVVFKLNLHFSKNDDNDDGFEKSRDEGKFLFL